MNLVLVRIHCQFAGITVATGPSTQLTQSSCSKLPPKEQIQDEIRVSVGVIGSDPLMQVMTSHLWAHDYPDYPIWIQVWFKLWHQWDRKTNPVIV